MIKHFQSTQSNKFAISRDGVHFLPADKHHIFYELALSFWMVEVVRHIQSTQNRKLVIFLQCDKKVLQLFLCSTVIQNVQIFNGGGRGRGGPVTSQLLLV